MLHIDWQIDVSGDRAQYHTALLGQRFILTVIGDVIVDSNWSLSTEGERECLFAGWKVLERGLFDVTCLDVKLLLRGTPYTRAVWNALAKIPVGQVMTYSELARQLKSGPRAVALACRKNPYPGIIPCHRVVSNSGIGGFMGQSEGQWVRFKQQLLDYERKIV